jgi:hypothetical protein
MPPALIEQGEAFFDHTMRQALLAIGVDPETLERSAWPPPG